MYYANVHTECKKRRRGKKKEKRRETGKRCGARVRNDRSSTEERRRTVSIGIFIIYILGSLISANLETGGEKEAFREYLARVLRFTLYLLKRNNEKKTERDRERERKGKKVSRISRVDRDRWGENRVRVIDPRTPFVPVEQMYITNTRSRSRRPYENGIINRYSVIVIKRMCAYLRSRHFVGRGEKERCIKKKNGHGKREGTAVVYTARWCEESRRMRMNLGRRKSLKKKNLHFLRRAKRKEKGRNRPSFRADNIFKNS